MTKVAIAAAIVVALASGFAWLAETRDSRAFVKHLVAGLALLGALMGLGAVFGKTLGDFLRQANGP
jgi:H+/gluconate symporter-like permease